jgi:hypothetical protein
MTLGIRERQGLLVLTSPIYQLWHLVRDWS